MGNTKLVDITGLSRYHENLKNVFNTKQDVIDDLDAIRSGAAAGAGALDAANGYADGVAATAEKNAKDYADGKFQVAGDYEVAGAADAALEDAKSYVDSKVDGKFDAAGAAATAEKNAKDYADGKFQVAGNYEAAGAAAEALEAAKEYADGLATNYEAAGAAATAEKNAKDYADGKFQVAGDYEVAGTAAGLNEVMNERVAKLEAIDHEKLAADASAAAVATVLDGAPEKFDTLKEVAEWISASDSASSAADLVTRVTALEAIDHDAYVDADVQVLADANAYADGLASNYEVAGAAATAEKNAKDYADGKFQVAGNYETAGAAAQALVDAKAYVDGKVDGKFDAAGAAAQALADAKADAASLYQVKGNYEAAGAAAQALADAQAYVDGKGYLTADDLVFAEDGDIDALFA